MAVITGQGSAGWWRAAAQSSALGALWSVGGGGGREWGVCEGGVGVRVPFYRRRRASDGAGRWFWPTGDEGWRHRGGVVVTSARWRQRAGESRRCARLRGRGSRGAERQPRRACVVAPRGRDFLSGARVLQARVRVGWSGCWALGQGKGEERGVQGVQKEVGCGPE
jgi:hypothetical protein